MAARTMTIHQSILQQSELYIIFFEKKKEL